ncbi:MAG: hypothetical protein Q7Q73_07465 [Verrucomicrobiota bacterium JB024]|nr:hypothetical protein [Verrucomicrobiota bacterium JB024]
MANYLSTQAAKLVASVSDVSRLNQNPLDPLNTLGAGAKRGGLLLDFTVDAGAAATEKVYLGILKAGWTVNPLLSYGYTHSDAGDALVGDVGYEKIKASSTLTANDDAFADGIALSAVGQVGFASGTAPVALTGTPVTLSEDVWLIWTYRTATNVNAVKVSLYFDLLL